MIILKILDFFLYQNVQRYICHFDIKKNKKLLELILKKFTGKIANKNNDI